MENTSEISSTGQNLFKVNKIYTWTKFNLKRYLPVWKGVQKKDIHILDTGRPLAYNVAKKTIKYYFATTKSTYPKQRTIKNSYSKIYHINLTFLTIRWALPAGQRKKLNNSCFCLLHHFAHINPFSQQRIKKECIGNKLVRHYSVKYESATTEPKRQINQKI